MNKKIFALIYTISILLAFIVGTQVFNSYSAHKTPQINDNIFIQIERTTGTEYLTAGNLITNIGENYTRNALSGGGTVANVSYISIGNATAAVALTELTSEYVRVVGTVSNWTYSGDASFNVTATYTFTETQTLDAIGAHWVNTGNLNLYAVADVTETTFNADDNATITWMFVYDAN